MIEIKMSGIHWNDVQLFYLYNLLTPEILSVS